MKIFVTGASGLLGGHLAAILSKNHTVGGGGRGQSRFGVESVPLDITSVQSVADALDGKGYDVVVHAAAIRSPEEAAADVGRAYLVNTASVDILADACNRNSAKLVYVSTDFVFPGDNPPYQENAPARPVNLYGRTKYAGELAARTAATHLIVRIPVLWDKDPDDPKGLQKDFIAKFRTGKPLVANHVTLRHYSLASDVAGALAFAIVINMAGVIHLSARERQTKADFARAMADLNGFDPALVVDGTLPEYDIPRPHDSTLDTSMYDRLGGPKIRDLSEAVRDLKRERDAGR